MKWGVSGFSSGCFHGATGYNCTEYAIAGDWRMQTLNKLPRIACVVAFVIAAINIVVGALGPIAILPFSIVPISAGVGILRKRAWSAYGLATLFFAQLFLVPVIALRHWLTTGQSFGFAADCLLWVGLGILFLMAGRSITTAGGSRGSAWPWILVTVLFTAPFFFVHTFEIPSGAMESTLLPGDSIVAQVFPLLPPKRAQIILFISPTERSLILVKRVIGIPGDHLHIEGNNVILNGTTLDEKYVKHGSVKGDFYPGDFPNQVELPGCAEGHEMMAQHVANGEIVVPAENYFVMGDNREDSLDSRCWGFVSSRDVIGKTLIIYNSVERSAEQESDPTQKWLESRRWSRLFKVP